MIKVGDRVRILENAVVGNDNITVTRLHKFAIGSIVKVIRVYDQDALFAIGKDEGSDNTIWQYLVNTENLKQFEKVTDKTISRTSVT